MGLALGFAILATRMWRADLAFPLRPGGDTTPILAAIKAVTAGGSFLDIPQLGAPHGLSWADYPLWGGSGLSLLAIKALGVFTSNPAVIVNLYYVAGFPLVALVAFLVLRRLGVSRASASVVSVLYALLPTHFIRGEAHLFLSSYIAAPLGCYLVLRVLGGEPIFARSEFSGSGARGWLTRRNLAPLGICVLIGGLGTVYYAAFTVALVAVSGLIVAAAARDARLLRGPIALLAAIFVVAAIPLVPSVVYRARHGVNPEIVHRHPFESEKFGLRIASLVLPQPENRIPALAALGRRYVSQEQYLGGVNEDSTTTLGVVGSAGFVGLLAVGVVAIFRRRASPDPPPLADRAALATLIGLLIAVAGGFALLSAMFIAPEIRAWNRISVFIALFAMLGVALALDRLRVRLGGGGRARLAVAAVLAAALMFGVYEQTNDGPDFVRPYHDQVAAARVTARLVTGIERTLPRGAAVWQLPYTGFPEVPPRGAELPYAQLEPYLYSSSLRWSGGAMRGRPADWQEQMTNVPLPSLLRGVAAAGFDGALVDRLAYADGGGAVTAQLTRIAGPPAIVSTDARYAFFDLRGYARSLRASLGGQRIGELARATVTPVRLQFGQGFYDPDPLAGGARSYWANAVARLDVVNPTRSKVSALLTGTFVAGDTGRVEVRLPDGRAQSVQVSPGGAPWRAELVIPPGALRVTFIAHVPQTIAPSDPRTLYVQMLRPALVQRSLGLP
jgi:phosphoglycerol transferase